MPTIKNKTVNLGQFFEGDKAIWMVLFFLCIISILEVYSASSTMTFKGTPFWEPIIKHTILLLVGVGITWFVHKIPCRFFGWIVVLGPFISIILLALAFFTKDINGASRWLEIGGLSIQPSEMAKGSLIVVVAWLLSVMRDENGATSSAFKWILGFTAITCCMIVTENLSTAGITFIVILMMMFIGRVPNKLFAPMFSFLLIVAVAGFSFLRFAPESVIKPMSEIRVFKRVPVWAERVRHLGFPESPNDYDFVNTNIQITQSHIAIATCNVIGRGPGNSTVRDSLPQAYSDFIFAIIIEELGIFGSFFVLLLYITLLYRSARIAKRCKKNFPAFLIMGLALLICTQALINMTVAVFAGILPITGQPLPLVSKGGSSILVNCAYIGMMLSISRTASLHPEDESSEMV